MLLSIFAYLDDISLWKVSEVCKRWRTILETNTPQAMWQKYTKERWPLFESLVHTPNWFHVSFGTNSDLSFAFPFLNLGFFVFFSCTALWCLHVSANHASSRWHSKHRCRDGSIIYGQLNCAATFVRWTQTQRKVSMLFHWTLSCRIGRRPSLDQLAVRMREANFSCILWSRSSEYLWF